MNIKKDFGARIKELRIKKGITQYQLAELINIDPKHMSHIETGRSFPKADLIEKLALAFNLEYTELFKTNHLQNRQNKIEKINKILKEISDNDLNVIFKIINSYLN
ncbi:MAG: helix-turn-helix transcriptional regulator [Cyanobacteria bacterium SIG27]|nr:helix-turn-helix transcriptional regulator [Cyanobacteria bacterium SIG27]